MKNLTIKDYQETAARTANHNHSKEAVLANYGLGLTGEAGEVADNIKKFVFHEHDLDEKEMIKELGDVFWYLANIATILGVSLEEVAQKNIDKLKERYPEGFDTEKSKNRKEYQEGAN